MTETLRDRLGLHSPKEFRVKANGVVGVDPTLLYGVELEIENLEDSEHDRADRAVAGMQYHKDGSLRNNGGEFVTSPMNFSALYDTLNRFFKAHKYTEENYSERCSVHVHANCQDLTLDQIRLVICLYQILEKVLFNFVKADRDNNIFCVPLGESVIASKIMESGEVLIQKANRNWRKYTALNLLPLYTQGTMEFRHMAGTCDVEFILQWCNIIGSLFKYAREHKFEDVVKTLMDLNTSSAYATFMQGIFQDNLYEVLAVGQYREFLEEGVINMKVMLANEPPVTHGKKPTYVLFDDVVGAADAQAVAAQVGQWANIPAGMAQINANPFEFNALPQHPPRQLTLADAGRVNAENANRAARGLRAMRVDQIWQWLDQHPEPVVPAPENPAAQLPPLPIAPPQGAAARAIDDAMNRLRDANARRARPPLRPNNPVPGRW